MEYLSAIWEFVSNPPIEVTQAVLQYGKDVGVCIWDATLVFGQSVLDTAKNVL